MPRELRLPTTGEFLLSEELQAKIKSAHWSIGCPSTILRKSSPPIHSFLYSPRRLSFERLLVACWQFDSPRLRRITCCGFVLKSCKLLSGQVTPTSRPIFPTMEKGCYPELHLPSGKSLFA